MNGIMRKRVSHTGCSLCEIDTLKTGSGTFGFYKIMNVFTKIHSWKLESNKRAIKSHGNIELNQ